MPLLRLDLHAAIAIPDHDGRDLAAFDPFARLVSERTSSVRAAPISFLERVGKLESLPPERLRKLA